MAAQSELVALGTAAADFALPDGAGRLWRLADFAGSTALLVAFICNHCPYVVHIIDGFVDLVPAYQARGVGVIAISANDADAYPEDAPARMAEFARAHRFSFPYVYDESQAVARAYGAACTPEFYVFDASMRLAYHGQMDGSRPRGAAPEPVTGRDLRAALDAVLAGEVPPIGRPSVGCSIKWKPGVG